VRIDNPCPKQQNSYRLFRFFGIVNESASGGGGGQLSGENNLAGEHNAGYVAGSTASLRNRNQL
jgi:hypothetical protein